jgi:SAM-dependent methyltransferase
MSLTSAYGAVFRYNDYNRHRFVADVAKGLAPGARVLDAGAGPCRYRPLFSHCDYKAQDFGRYEGSEHRYGELDYVGDITAVPAPDGSFDLILCTEVFEHLPRPDLALIEFARLLRSGGELVLTAPLGAGIHMPPYHFYGGFTPHWYEHFLAASDFEIASIRPNGGFFKLYGQESQRFLTLLTPSSRLGRWLFFPVKLVLAIWFRFLMPLACHFLDKLDRKKEFTAGYFVRARRR